MDNHNYVLIMQKQQNLLFYVKKYEEETRLLYDCDIDDVEGHVKERERLIKLIDVNTKDILKICPEGSDQYKAFKNSCDRDELSPADQQIFDLRQQFNSYAYKAHALDHEIIERIKHFRDQVKEKIVENNSGQTAKAAKFYGGGLNNGNNLFIPKNKKQI